MHLSPFVKFWQKMFQIILTTVASIFAFVCCLMALVEQYSLDLSCRRFLASLFCMNFIRCIRSTLNFKLPVLIQVNNIALTILMMCELLWVSSHISYFLKSEGNSVNQFNISEWVPVSLGVHLQECILKRMEETLLCFLYITWHFSQEFSQGWRIFAYSPLST